MASVEIGYVSFIAQQRKMILARLASGQPLCYNPVRQFNIVAFIA